ncbi:uncharacterized protein LOC129751209 [Uranotaenia lowii]|uniref:uncharacterized protein LOC129751209 n=1 Tax=Uranotaenia lowii TaxID=190385 RepID=UPI00247919F9|nr:uncharacterized protein LOC129751209 [Uranotaenia lowii]
MFKILSEAAKGITALKQLEAAGKLAKSRPYSSSSRKGGCKSDAPKSKECAQKACSDRSQAMPKKGSKSHCKKSSPKIWRACPEPPKPKEFSCSDVPQELVSRRKKRQVASKPPCNKPAPSVEAPECIKIKKELCLRATMPGCAKSRIPPRCPPKKVVRDCTRIKPPVPSFSACYRNPFPRLPRSECTVLTTKKICM